MRGDEFDDFVVVAKTIGQMRGVYIGKIAPNQAFGGRDGVERIAFLIGKGFAPRLNAARCQIAHHRRQRHRACFIGQAHRRAAFNGGNQTVGGAQIDAHGKAVLVRRGGKIGLGNLQKCHDVVFLMRVMKSRNFSIVE